MNKSTFWMIKYMNGSVFSKARYMNGVGFEILARTPVPKLPLSYPPPPPTHTHRDTGANSEGVGGFRVAVGNGSVEYPSATKFHFHEKFWVQLLNLRYCLYPKYSHAFNFLPYTFLQ